MLARAPLLAIRGNHEDCERGGPAWFRYLDGGDTVTPCTAGAVDGTLPWAVSFPGLRIVVNDSAADASDSKPDPARIAFYEASYRKAQALAAGTRSPCATAYAWPSPPTGRPPRLVSNSAWWIVSRISLEEHFPSAP